MHLVRLDESFFWYVICVLLKIQVLCQIKKLPKIISLVYLHSLYTILVLNIIPDTRHLMLMNACKFCDPNQCRPVLQSILAWKPASTWIHWYMGWYWRLYTGVYTVHSTYSQWNISQSQPTSHPDWCDDPPGPTAHLKICVSQSASQVPGLSANKDEMKAEPGSQGGAGAVSQFSASLNK